MFVLAGCEDHVCQNIILNLSPGPMRDVVGLTMSVVIILSYILILVPAREHLETICLSYIHTHICHIYPPHGHSHSEHSIQGSGEMTVSHAHHRTEVWAQNILRTIIVLGTVLVALYFPYSASMLGAVGGLTDALQCFVLPPLIFLQLEKDSITAYSSMYYRCVILWGCVVILYTVTYSLTSLFISP